MQYHIWTEGCQMNVADSQRVASALEKLGYTPAPRPAEADVIVLNTCVVRQSAEDKAAGHLFSLRPLKEKHPNLVINLMGCMVGVKGYDRLKKRFPFVDVFSPPSDPGPLLAYLTQDESRTLEQAETEQRYVWMDEGMEATIAGFDLTMGEMGEMDVAPGGMETVGEADTAITLRLPAAERGQLVSAFVPVVLGCSHACTFCIIPYRRGVERSRRVGDILSEARALVAQGVKEITLLGQIVDRYGKDIHDGPNLAALLRILHDIEGLQRIRFLTSHPNWMSAELLDTIAELPKVMSHIEVPVQAGDDAVLKAMKRGYTTDDYRRLVEKIRQRLNGGFPGVSIATDVIVGFPGETAEQFQRTHDLLAELRFDVAHLARYSPRPGTLAHRRMTDDVSEEEKWARFRALESLQERIAGEINAHYLGETVEVLFEQPVRGRWKGRTPTNKLVFVESEADLRGRLLPVSITWTGSWSMQGSVGE